MPKVGEGRSGTPVRSIAIEASAHGSGPVKSYKMSPEELEDYVDETLNIKIAERLKVLKKFRFEDSGFILRPAVSSIELFDEGKALEHCVGGYAKNYAEGRTYLFVLRRASEPDIPFYTMEISGQEIRHVRGKKNCSPDEDVKAFIETFKAAKLSKKRNGKLKMLSA